MTLGRNDPCHCGSGKKYKKCHWNEDQQRAAERAAKERARQARLAAMGHPADNEARGLYEEVTGRTAPAGPLNQELRQMISEIWQQRRLAEKSTAELEPHRDEWAAYFTEHPAEFDEIASELGRDPYFDDYVLTDENVEKVEEALGPLPEEEAAWSDYASRAIALSLDDDDRTMFQESLLSLLPELLEAGQIKEAYVVATCADRVLDPEAPLSPFLRDVVVRSLHDL